MHGILKLIFLLTILPVIIFLIFKGAMSLFRDHDAFINNFEFLIPPLC